MERENRHEALNRACEFIGGPAQLGRKLAVTRQAVNDWLYRRRQIPAERCPLIERATGGLVRCEELRPDVDWSVLRTAA